MLLSLIPIVQKALTVIFLLGGMFFFLAATIGLLRLPDFYSRLHSTGKGDTLTMLLSFIGLAIYEGYPITVDSLTTSAKIILIAVFMFYASPTATHAVCRAAFRCGVEPWTKEQEEETP